jgi:hypothetical protein
MKARPAHLSYRRTSTWCLAGRPIFQFPVGMRVLPELPDVERFKHILARNAVAKRIERIVVSDARINGLLRKVLAPTKAGACHEPARRLAGQAGLQVGGASATGQHAGEIRGKAVRVPRPPGRKIVVVPDSKPEMQFHR